MFPFTEGPDFILSLGTGELKNNETVSMINSLQRGFSGTILTFPIKHLELWLCTHACSRKRTSPARLSMGQGLLCGEAA